MVGLDVSLFFGDNRTCDTIAETHLSMLGTFSLTALVMMVLVGYIVKKVIFRGQGGIYDALPTINTSPESSGDPPASGPAVTKFRRESLASYMIALGGSPTLGVWVFGVSLSGYLFMEGDCVNDTYKLLSGILIPTCLFVVTSAQITFWILFQDVILGSFAIPTSDGGTIV